MISAIQNFITSPAIFNATQSTVTQVTTETCLKAVGRPTFILTDKQIDPQTKKFSATKEFLYQITCLAIYLAAITPICKKGAFALAKKAYKNEPIFQAFKDSSEFMKFHKMDESRKIAKLTEINKAAGNGDKFTRSTINQDSENLARGVVEAGSMFGSVAGLAILAPIISHPIIHPVMKMIGMDNPKDAKSKQETPQPEQKQEI